MRQILVTGANGFIGRALCQRMLTMGCKIRGTVRSAKHLSGLPSGIDVLKVESIGPETNWMNALNGVDVVVHLAARVHMMDDTASDPLAAFRRVNVKGTERLVQQAAATGCRRFIFMSTVKVNGERTGGCGQKSEVRSQWSGVSGQEKTEVRGQKSEVRGQKSEVRGQEKPEVRGQRAGR